MVNTNLILRLFDAGSDSGILIHYYQHTGNVGHIRVSTYYLRVSFCGDTLFGRKELESWEKKIVKIALD